MPYALVTGCDHGLGPALVRGLVLRGYEVAACRLNPEEHLIDDLAREYPGAIHVYPLDIASDESVRQLRGLLDMPSLDLLINCAGILGIMEEGPDEPLDFDLMLKVINVNALGTLRVTTALLPLLETGTGKTVINISSEAGSIQDCWRRGWFGYCMSKSANNMQGALIHNTLRDMGGQVIQMHPGHVATYMRGHLDTTAGVTPEESAAGILHTVLDIPHPVGSCPLFLDFQGKTLPY